MKKTNKKLIAMLLVMALLVGGAVGGTLAWLLDKTDTITNTFTDSDINITLEESKGDATSVTSDTSDHEFQMIPGHTIDKDPKVTVKANSEMCYLFVKIDESTTPDLDHYITYAIAGGWTEYQNEDENGDTVIYRIVNESESDQPFDIIGYNNGSDFVVNKVLVNSSVTKADMDSIDEGAVKPTLSFTAYACQYYQSNGVPFEVTAAWNHAKTLAE